MAQTKPISPQRVIKCNPAIGYSIKSGIELNSGIIAELIANIPSRLIKTMNTARAIAPIDHNFIFVFLLLGH